MPSPFLYKEGIELAIEITKIDAATGTVDMVGLSTDDKPVGDVDNIIPIGTDSSFYELDTKKVFIYSKKNINPVTSNNWWEV
jgi:hypothetical protein